MTTYKMLLMLLLTTSCNQLVKANNGENREKKSLESSVQGNVTDATTHRPVTGVTVSILSNKMRTGKEMQSDAAGCFTFVKLPAGDLTLMFAKKGYKLFKSDLLSVKEGSSTRISIDFQPEEDDVEIWHPLLKLLE